MLQDRTREFRTTVESMRSRLLSRGNSYGQTTRISKAPHHAPRPEVLHLKEVARALANSINTTQLKLKKHSLLVEKQNKDGVEQTAAIGELANLIQQDIAFMMKELTAAQEHLNRSTSFHSRQQQAHVKSMFSALQTKILSLTNLFQDSLDAQTKSLVALEEARKAAAIAAEAEQQKSQLSLPGNGVTSGMSAMFTTLQQTTQRSFSFQSLRPLLPASWDTGTPPPSSVEGSTHDLRHSVANSHHVPETSTVNSHNHNHHQHHHVTVPMSHHLANNYHQQDIASSSYASLVPLNAAQQTQMFEQEEQQVRQRDTEIQRLQHTIIQVGELFQQMSFMVKEQEEMVTRIDHNVDDFSVNVEGAHMELLKYLKTMSSNRSFMIKFFLVLLALFVIFVYVLL